MQITLFVHILINDPQKDDVPSFLKERRQVLQQLADGLRRFEPMVRNDDLIFHGISMGDRMLIEDYCRQNCKMKLVFVANAVYVAEEIQHARFVPLGIVGDGVDCNDNGKALNHYPKRLCDACWSYDLTAVPDPFVIQRPTRMQSLYHASNGVKIVSAALWHELRATLEPWVRVGSVSYSDAPDHPVKEYVWIMPTELIGPYSRTFVADTCGVCHRPIYAYFKPAEDDLLLSMDIVTHIPPTDAPIALVGMWHGRFIKGRQPRVSWPVVISGELHECLRAMKVKGFGPVDRPIHTQVEAERLLAR